ncbi:hypothetical protein NGRA_2004 [Nosema granulosis]|uniref:Uncharacterized protein n=1 Tax=Nosema granulosis TaxID=83296 RepID=A0A9P6KYL7_9MICR|nr:hypothetical protein NGRA_2004 [Nosema granulosis]
MGSRLFLFYLFTKVSKGSSTIKFNNEEEWKYIDEMITKEYSGFENYYLNNKVTTEVPLNIFESLNKRDNKLKLEDNKYQNEDKNKIILLKKDIQEFDCILKNYIQPKKAALTIVNDESKESSFVSTSFYLSSEKISRPQVFKTKKNIEQLDNIRNVSNILRYQRNSSTKAEKACDILRRDRYSLQKWKIVVSSVIYVLENIHKFYYSEDIYSVHPLILQSFTTAENIEDVLKFVIDTVKIRKLRLPEGVQPISSLQKEIAKLHKIFKFNVNETKCIKRLYHCAKRFAENNTIKELIILLIQKIQPLKIKLFEMKSIILLVFYQNSFDSNQKTDSKFLEYQKIFISKVILLLQLVSTLSKNEDPQKQVLYKNKINKIIMKLLARYTAVQNAEVTLKGMLNFKSAFENLCYEGLLPHNDCTFIFLLTGKKCDVFRSYINPFVQLKESLFLQKKFEACAFTHLLNCIKMLYDIVDIILCDETIKK